jgi:hypothetical protein
VSQFTFAPLGACYPPFAGDFRGPVISAAGTRYFEPDGVAFCGRRTLPDETIGAIDEAIYPWRRRHPETNEGY